MELVELLYFFGVCLAYRDLPLARYLMAWRPGPTPLPAFLQSSQAGAETEFSVEQYQASGIPRCIGSRCCKWFLAASLHTLGSSKVITKVLLPSGCPNTAGSHLWAHAGVSWEVGGHPKLLD